MEFIDMTLRHDGTVSAEHGVGLAKSPYIRDNLEGLQCYEGDQEKLWIPIIFESRQDGI